MKNSPTGILLLNMGGPDSLEDVPGFLFNLFSDREIIRLGPAFLQKPLAWFISRRRSPKSQNIYRKIGGSSPLRRITEEQASALGRTLAHDGDFIIKVAMRYWEPSAKEAVVQMRDMGIERIIALPLYPHYTKATSGSSLNDLRKACSTVAPHIVLNEISSWPTEPHYIKALAKRISEGVKSFAEQPFQLVYSAHSLPVSFIQQGDPYVDELNKTIFEIEKLTGIAGKLCYQSRSGPVEWLSPSTSDMIQTLADTGCKNILMMPISFVSDHVETLYEIDMQFKEEAETLGMRLESTPALNCDPLFIEGLRELVLEQLQ
ncbi:ferrochelatase [Desulfosediminicola flagellatus]|uniref:ferrochelatase n=1 Tax=Desulfosediminicola flagellatus TaxID=2569541 RepID=UPI0010AD0751|nr:ferrochelatase [Desulfosediminicola flagellatus]